MPRVRYTLRRLLAVVAVIALLLYAERRVYDLAMSAHTRTIADNYGMFVCFNVAAAVVAGVVWLWRRYARYD